MSRRWVPHVKHPKLRLRSEFFARGLWPGGGARPATPELVRVVFFLRQLCIYILIRFLPMLRLLVRLYHSPIPLGIELRPESYT